MAVTKKSAREIADGFLQSATAIDKYLDKNWGSISRAEYETLSESARTLLRVSAFMTTEAVGLAIADMKNEGDELKKVTSAARRSLAKLESVKSAIRVVAGIVDLATAIMSKDPGAVFKAAKGLRETVKEA